MTVQAQVATQTLPDLEKGGLGGHPKGLNVLFFTELWERFSYYGMRAILVLFMIAPRAEGGMGLTMDRAADIYAWYTMCVYLTSIPGGLVADRLIGPRLAIVYGGIIIALGHFTMAIRSDFAFYAGMILIVLGTGLLKPNISTMVGKLYPAHDPRRDAGFSIFYMGINLGATLSPLVCGYLAQDKSFKTMLVNWGIPAETCWHFGFAAAGVGMCLGLAHLFAQYKLLDHIGGRPKNKDSKARDQAEERKEQRKGDKEEQIVSSDNHSERGKLMAIACLFVFNSLFWMIYEQGGSSLNVFAEKLSTNQIFGWSFPSSWLQSLTPIYVIVFAPLFSILWTRLGARQPSSPAKFALGLGFLGLGVALMIPASILATHGKISPLFLIFTYMIEVLGELCLSPVGLSTVTKLAPIRFQSLIMGGWFCSSAIGNWLAGQLARSFDFSNTQAMSQIFSAMAIFTLFASGLLFAMLPPIRKWMGNVR